MLHLSLLPGQRRCRSYPHQLEDFHGQRQQCHRDQVGGKWLQVYVDGMTSATDVYILTSFPASASGTSETHGTSSASSSGAAHTTNAANNVKLGASGAGLFGLVLAAFAL